MTARILDGKAVLATIKDELKGRVAALAEQGVVPGLGTVAIPTLVVHGRNDPIPLESSRLVASAMPDARLVELDDCGHVPYVEAPIPLFTAMRHFLSEHDGPPSP